ncbi:hypothetical protein Pelo_2828 [Pelomyxa schiedti]|nr:hypothetical protein Pelo_2828 [Pelomyxa schiedti]
MSTPEGLTERLPASVLCAIASWLSPRDLLSFSNVNKSTRLFFSDQTTWQNLYANSEWKLPLSFNPDTFQWKTEYLKREYLMRSAKLIGLKFFPTKIVQLAHELSATANECDVQRVLQTGIIETLAKVSTKKSTKKASALVRCNGLSTLLSLLFYRPSAIQRLSACVTLDSVSLIFNKHTVLAKLAAGVSACLYLRHNEPKRPVLGTGQSFPFLIEPTLPVCALLSGNWRGFYFYNGGQTDAEVFIDFTFDTDGTVSGTGADIQGGFHYTGTLDFSTKIVDLTKSYDSFELTWKYVCILHAWGMAGTWGTPGWGGCFMCWKDCTPDAEHRAAQQTLIDEFSRNPHPIVADGGCEHQ